jgi:cytochrome oxidase Cu insertion factor (SCO1/SenC/PrrC family)
MILRGLATLVVLALFALNAVLPTAAVTARGTEDRVRADFDTKLAIGRSLPTLELFDLEGRRFTREDLLGHRVLLTFERSVDW